MRTSGWARHWMTRVAAPRIQPFRPTQCSLFATCSRSCTFCYNFPQPWVAGSGSGPIIPAAGQIRQRAGSGIRQRAGSVSGPEAQGRVRQRPGSGSGQARMIRQRAAGMFRLQPGSGRISQRSGSGTGPDQAAGRIRVYNKYYLS